MNDRKTTRAWISRYVLSRGIIECEAFVSELRRGEYVPVAGHSKWFRVGLNIHATLEEAVERAEAKRKRAVLRLRKRAEHWEAVRFRGVGKALDQLPLPLFGDELEPQPVGSEMETASDQA
jgi:hypothetical protein